MFGRKLFIMKAFQRLFWVLLLLNGFASCSDPGDTCEISNLKVITKECLTDSTYQLTVDFDYQHAANDFFDVFVREDQHLGYYSLADLPVTIEDFKLSGKDFDYLKVCINDRFDCCEEIEFETPICSDKKCRITDLEVDPGECMGDNTYNLMLNFEYANPGNDYFEVYVRDNQRIGTYKFSDLPISLENFETSGNEYDFIKVCVNDHPDCCKAIEFKAPDCLSEKCEIGELKIDIGNCTGDNTYNLFLNFEYANPGNDYFEVYGRDNQRIGTYKFSNLPISLENFETSGNEYDFIKVCVNDHPDCCMAIEFKAPDCLSEKCEIGELNIDIGNCTGDNTYNLFLNFEYANPGNDFFEVFVRENQRIGTYRFSDLPVKIENFESSGNDYDFIKVWVNDHPDCCSVVEFKAPECANQNCELTELTVSVGDCVNDSTYQLTINFDYTNPNNDYFEVFLRNDKRLGYYKLTDLPLTISEFRKSGKEYDFIKVCINDHPDCCKVLEFKSPGCE